MARTALRLLALLGFACVAIILCSTSANADSAGDPGQDAPPAPSTDGVPGLLTTTDTVLRSVVTPAAPQVPHAAAPAVHRTASADPVTAAISPIRDAVTKESPRSTGSPEHADPVALPLHDVLTPVVGAATQTVTRTLDAVADTTSSVSALAPATTLLRNLSTSTTQVASSVGSLTTHVDTGLVSVVAATDSLLTPLTGGDRQLASTGSSSSTSTGTSFAPPTIGGTSDIASLGVLGGLREPALSQQPTLTGSGPGVLAAPPQPAGVSAVQSVPAVVVAPATPAFGAVGTAMGSVPGTAVGGSSALHEQTEAPRGFDFRAVMAIGRACHSVVRPLPGTPLVDPGFSPD
ncbi:hypothetical protein [Nocardioides maradonensis]